MFRLWLIFWRSAVYEAKFLRHNSWDFTMLFWLPLATIFFIWWVFSRPIITDIPIAVIDQSHSQVSQTLVDYLEASPDLTVIQHHTNLDDAYNAILSQQVYGVVIIPKNFSSNVNSAKPAPVVLKVNAQYGTHSGIVQRGVQSAVGTISAGIEIKRLVKQGASPRQARINYSPISINRISLFNSGTNYQQFLASTVLPALLHILAMVIGAMTVGRELRDHSLGIWYQCVTTDSAHPDFEAKKHLPPHTNTIQADFVSLVMALNGKLILGLLPYTLWGAVVLVLAVESHPASLASVGVVYMLFLLLMMISLWLGAIFCLSTYSLRIGLSMTGFISAPSFAFAGITFPLIAMSESAQRWANILPLTPYLKVQIAQLQMLAPTVQAVPYIYGFILAVAGCMVVTVLLTKRAFLHPHKWGAR